MTGIGEWLLPDTVVCDTKDRNGRKTDLARLPLNFCSWHEADVRGGRVPRSDYGRGDTGSRSAIELWSREGVDLTSSDLCYVFTP